MYMKSVVFRDKEKRGEMGSDVHTGDLHTFTYRECTHKLVLSQLNKCARLEQSEKYFALGLSKCF